jgi:hypothetical protein
MLLVTAFFSKHGKTVHVAMLSVSICIQTRNLSSIPYGSCSLHIILLHNVVFKYMLKNTSLTAVINLY